MKIKELFSLLDIRKIIKNKKALISVICVAVALVVTATTILVIYYNTPIIVSKKIINKKHSSSETSVGDASQEISQDSSLDEFIEDDSDLLKLFDSKKLFFVATNGNDENAGTKAEPFATIQRAKEAVCEYKATESSGNITVFIRGGKYTLNETINFEYSDSGNADQIITYAAYPNEKPIITSGVPVTNWTKLSYSLEGMPQIAEGNLWVADIPVINNTPVSFKTMFDNYTRLKRARSDWFQPTNTEKTDYDKILYHFPKGLVRQWSNIWDVELFTKTVHGYEQAVMPFVSIDKETSTGKFSFETSYMFREINFWLDKTKSAYLENAIDFLDEPGEWISDTTAGKIYYWPVEGKPSNNISVPSLKEYVKIEGMINFVNPSDTPIKYIKLKGITFANGDRDTLIEEDYKYSLLQHGWATFDKADALVRLRGTRYCSVEDCMFLNSGGNALRLDLYAQENLVSGNKIDNMGSGGIILSGYGMGTKDVNKKNIVINNEMSNIANDFWFSHAIFVQASGENYIAHNLFRNLNSGAVAISGRYEYGEKDYNSKVIRWEEIETAGGLDSAYREKFYHSKNNIVEYNEIINYSNLAQDTNAIYVSGTGTGNVVRRNYIHDYNSIFATGAIRVDDAQNDTIISQNIITSHSSEGNIVIKGINNVLDNIIYDVKNTYNFKNGYYNFVIGPVKDSIFKRNIAYSKNDLVPTVNTERAYGYVSFDKSEIIADDNCYFSESSANWGNGHLASWRENGNEINSISQNPQFYNAEQEDFRLMPDSPMLNKGFDQFDFSMIGLRNSYKYANKGDDLRRIQIKSDAYISALSLSKGKTAALSVSATSYDGYKINPNQMAISFVSSDISVATVNENGLVTAKNKGRAVITVTVRKGNITKQANMYVFVDNPQKSNLKAARNEQTTAIGIVANAFVTRAENGQTKKYIDIAGAFLNILSDNSYKEFLKDRLSKVILKNFDPGILPWNNYEDGSLGWWEPLGASASVVNNEAHSGIYSVRVNKSEAYGQLKQTVKFQKGKTYKFMAYIKGNKATANARIVLSFGETPPKNTKQFEEIYKTTVSNNCWTKLEGIYQYNGDEENFNATFVIQYDMSSIQKSENLVNDPNKEEKLNENIFYVDDAEAVKLD